MRIRVPDVLCSFFVEGSEEFAVVDCHNCSVLGVALLQLQLQLRKVVCLKRRQLSDKIGCNVESEHRLRLFFLFFLFVLLVLLLLDL